MLRHGGSQNCAKEDAQLARSEIAIYIAEPRAAVLRNGQGLQSKVMYFLQSEFISNIICISCGFSPELYQTTLYGSRDGSYRHDPEYDMQL